MLAVLAMAMCLAYVDRHMAAVLAQPIKAHFRLTDTALSFVVGFAFAVCQLCAMFPLSVIADRFDRVRLIGAGIFVWSAMTLYCGLASDYWELFIGRMGVGLGEAALIPAAMSLIAERFHGHRRAVAMTFFLSSIPIGLGLAIYGGGWLLETFQDLQIGTEHGPFAPWQLTFVVVGLIGFGIAALTLTMVEPRRILVQPYLRRAGDISPFRFLARNSQLFIPIFLGCSLLNACVNGIVAWSPSLLGRSFDWSPRKIGVILGTFTVVFGLVGSMASGLLAAFLTRRSGRDPSLKITTAVALVLLPVTSLGILLASGNTIGLSLGIIMLCTFTFTTVAPLSVVGATPGPLRARVYALYLFINGLAGWAFGPTLYALFTDYALRDPLKLDLSIAVVSVLLLIPAASTLVLAQRAYSASSRDRIAISESASVSFPAQ